MRWALTFLIVLTACGWALSQESQDTTNLEVGAMRTDIDTTGAIPIESYAHMFDPRKAGLLSAVMPGLGQVYNKKYWKVPLVYGGIVGFTYASFFYGDLYQGFRRDLFVELGLDTKNVKESNLNERQLRNLVDRTRRERDFMLILAGVFYFLQIADAHIDAHLKEFQLNPELQAGLEPVLAPGPLGTPYAGISFKIRF